MCSTLLHCVRSFSRRSYECSEVEFRYNNSKDTKTFYHILLKMRRGLISSKTKSQLKIRLSLIEPRFDLKLSKIWFLRAKHGKAQIKYSKKPLNKKRFQTEILWRTRLQDGIFRVTDGRLLRGRACADSTSLRSGRSALLRNAVRYMHFVADKRRIFAVTDSKFTACARICRRS